MDEKRMLSVEKELKKATHLFLKNVDGLMGKIGPLLKEGAGQAKKAGTHTGNASKGGESNKKENKNKKEDDHKKQDEDTKIPGRTQFKMLMDAAGEAACVEELLLYLAYQESRHDGWGTKWEEEETIAKAVKDSLDAIQSTVLPEIKKSKVIGETTEEEERIIKLAIVKKYLGYLYWKATVVMNQGTDKIR